ncbi:hypothetical protein ACSBL2_06145 [Pedobacter sp. AW31-3R]|uniref:hypothetical protein n=1 Tax=Pedobacter sp. AW31-3R TaxID=3445781 RepID=UPI003F9EC421
MDQETADYIFNYYSILLNDKEKLALRHLHSLIKLDCGNDPNVLNTNIRLYKKIGWLTEDQDALALVLLGEEKFKLKAADRIWSEHKEKIQLNCCPKCNRLTRTPKARQCRHCGFNWH